MKSTKLLSLAILFVALFNAGGFCESEYTVFDDKMLLEGYTKKYSEESKETLIEMMKDEQLTPYMTAGAISVFRQRFSNEVVSAEKATVEKILLRRLSRSDSNFIDIAVMHTLCVMDRYKYFESTIPALIQFLDHYNSAVNELAFNGINDIINTGAKKRREAKIVFNTLRKNLFLSRKKLVNVKEPGIRLKQKIELLRWAIKILGTQELEKLPREIIDFM